MRKKNDKTRFNSPHMASLINEKKISELDEFLDDIIIQYKLNEDQEAVLRTFIESLKIPSKSPITLVHGVFYFFFFFFFFFFLKKKKKKSLYIFILYLY